MNDDTSHGVAGWLARKTSKLNILKAVISEFWGPNFTGRITFQDVRVHRARAAEIFSAETTIRMKDFSIADGYFVPRFTLHLEPDYARDVLSKIKDEDTWFKFVDGAGGHFFNRSNRYPGMGLNF